MVFKTVCLKHITWPFFKHPEFRNIANIWFISIYSKYICFSFCLKHFRQSTMFDFLALIPYFTSYLVLLMNFRITLLQWDKAKRTWQRNEEDGNSDPLQRACTHILFFILFFHILNEVNGQAGQILASDQFCDYATKADFFFFFFRGEDKHSQANEQEQI